MRLSKTGTLILLLLASIGLLPLNFRFLPSLVSAQAQTMQDRKAEADRLLQEGIQASLQPSISPYRVFPPLEAALRLYRELKNHQGAMAALNSLGNAHEAFGHYQEAVDAFQQALSIARDIKDRRTETDILNNLGYAYTFPFVQDEQQTIQYYQQALRLAREIHYRAGEVDALNRLGIFYKHKGDYPKAIACYKQSLAIAREINDQEGIVMVLTNLELVYSAQGDDQQAHDYGEQRLAIGREDKEKQIQSTLLSSLEQCQEKKDRFCEMIAFRDAGGDYGALDSYLKEIEAFEKALQIAYALKEPTYQEQYLLRISQAYSALKNYSKAIETGQMALAISRKINDTTFEARMLNLLSETYRAVGKNNSANDSQRLGSLLSSPPNPMQTGGSRDSKFGSAMRLFETGKFAEAEKLLLEEIEQMEPKAGKVITDEDYKKWSYSFGNYYALKVYSALQQALIGQNKIEQALEIAERGRARVFAELLAKRLQSPIQPIQISRIKQIAKEQKATLVEYSQINDEQLFVWVVKPTGETAFRKIDLKPLKQQNISLDKLVVMARCLGSRACERTVVSQGDDRGGIEITYNPIQADLQEHNSPPHKPRTLYLQELHKLLIEPIADLLPTIANAHLIFVPQGSLLLVPFAALQDAQGKYLIEQHTIALAPSIQVLELTHKQRQQVQQVGRQQALVVGNPTMPLHLPQLPGAQQEAQAIALLLHTQAIIGAQATKAVIVQQMPKARMIHLATHGILDDQGGLNSAIALAPTNSTGQANDGLLTADDILNMKLNAELVVLSACDTGRGRITGDGVIGLSRSLISAGVPSVIVSLWSIPDAPTASLMTQFYQNLQHTPDKAQALRQAMLSTMKDHPEPVDWAAFTLIGEAQ